MNAGPHLGGLGVCPSGRRGRREEATAMPGWSLRDVGAFLKPNMKCVAQPALFCLLYKDSFNMDNQFILDHYL